ncbi:unnamed protein product [Macrosiphum euphorbiae]|uniref:Uncharacterized protein n=1 Tax=Macrosiphum euphorbiae TaxID=13131 RepID=A0AAV0VPH1_9HEMI|nr:unnamed protein product [Macrosiphum euphorbiae]
MITFGQHFAISLATQQHKNKNEQEHQQDYQNLKDTAPGGVNILLGGVMMSSMILFILWMCYCCRWKDNKFDTTTCDEQPQPFWIDVNSNTYYEALQWSLQQECCEIPEAYCSPETMQETPPRYETVITPPPGYEDVMRENYKKKKSLMDVTENNRMHTI